MRRYIKEHLAIKVFLVTVVLLLAVSGAIYGMIALGMSRSYLIELNTSLDEQTRELISQLPEVSYQEMDSILDTFAIEYGISMKVKDDNGNEVKSYGEKEYDLSPEADSSRVYNSIGITKTYSVKLKDGMTYQILVFGKKQQANVALKSLNSILPMLGLITFFSALVIAAFYTRYVTKPVLIVSDASKKMSNLDFKIQCPETRCDEIGILGENLNNLAERLEEALDELKEKNKMLERDIKLEQQMEEQQLAFFSAVSHELKTPVTILKGQLQGMLFEIGGYKDRDKYLRRSCEVVCSLEGMIEEILSVTKIKSTGFSLNRVNIDLSQMIKEVKENMEDIAIDRGLQIHMELAEHIEIYADKPLFEKLVSNVISNAIKYTEENGNIWLRVYKKKEDIFFSVENEVEPITEEEIPRLFDAFYRRDKSRNRKAGGSGLGLYIVKMIIELHRFSYQFHNTEHGVEIKIRCTE